MRDRYIFIDGSDDDSFPPSAKNILQRFLLLSRLTDNRCSHITFTRFGLFSSPKSRKSWFLKKKKRYITRHLLLDIFFIILSFEILFEVFIHICKYVMRECKLETILVNRRFEFDREIDYIASSKRYLLYNACMKKVSRENLRPVQRPYSLAAGIIRSLPDIDSSAC